MTPSRRREYTAADGLRVDDLLQYGLDHISTAEHLLKQSASYYDGAGYLAHMGFELLLKAWLLHQNGSFPATHKLVHLIAALKQANPAFTFTKAVWNTLPILELYEKLRYPDRSLPMEVGSDQWPAIKTLSDELWSQMPSELKAIADSLDPLQKGGRILMKKKI